MNLSLKSKIIFNMWLLTLLCTIASAVMSIWVLVNKHERLMEQQLKSTAMTLITMGINDYTDLKNYQELETFIDDALNIKKSEQVINVFAKKGKTIFSSPPLQDKKIEDFFTPVDKPTFGVLEINDLKYKILTTPYGTKKRKKYYLQIARPFLKYSELISSALQEFLVLFSLLTTVAFIISQILAKKLVRPVRDVAEHLNKLDTKDMNKWSPLILKKSEGYLADIETGINDLIVRVKRTLYSMSRTGHYFAHEIRTPLTIILGEAEQVLENKNATPEDYRKVLKSSVEEAERMNNVVSTVLKIAKKEQRAYHLAPCNLNHLINETITKWEKSFSFKFEVIPPDREIIGLVDPDLVRRILDNLVNNILHHSLSHRCRMSVRQDDKNIILSVEDWGKGLDPHMINALNNKDLSYAGLGIGLVLCLEIASICQFDLKFTNKDYGGLLVEILI